MTLFIAWLLIFHLGMDWWWYIVALVIWGGHLYASTHFGNEK